MMAVSMIEQRAAELDAAQTSATPIAQRPADAVFSLDEAYAIQAVLRRLRVARGDARVGLKLAFTNRAAMLRLGVQEPVHGSLHASMLIDHGTQLCMTGRIRPRIEPELAFRLGRDLPAGASLDEAWAAIDAIAPAIEIVDSRYRDFQFCMTDVAADNASASGVVLGPWRRDAGDIAALAVQVEIDGEPVASGTTAAILGHPLEALRAAADLASRLGLPMQAGTILMAGSATDAIPVKAGQRVLVRIEGLGEVAFSLVP